CVFTVPPPRPPRNACSAYAQYDANVPQWTRENGSFARFAKARRRRHETIERGQFSDSWLRTSAHRPATDWYSSAALGRSPALRLPTDSWISRALWSLSSSSQLNRSDTPA